MPDPKEKTLPAGVVDVVAAVTGPPNPNPPTLLLESFGVSLGNWYGGGAEAPKLNGACEDEGARPNENPLDDEDDVVVAPVVEPNVKMELELAGTSDPTAAVVTAEVVGKPKAVGAAEVVGKAKAVGAAEVGGNPKVVEATEVVGKPKAVGAAEVVGRPKVVAAVDIAGKPNVVGAAVEAGTPKATGAVVADGKPKAVATVPAVFIPNVEDVAVVDGTPKVVAVLAATPPKVVGPPKLKVGAAVGLNSASEDAEVAAPVKLKEVDDVVGANNELLEVSASFPVVPVPSFRVDFSPLPNENEVFA